MTDKRTPSPPYGYSRECTHNREQQIHIVAEFHAHKIQPNRIAYRVGIDIAFIEELIESKRRKGVVQYELQQKIEAEFQREVDL
jgi:DNA-binding transcriptional regulator LsrR (DeoR family)